MSDDEQVHSEEEPKPHQEDEEPKAPKPKMAPPPEDTGPTEAQLAMQKRREKKIEGLDEEAEEILEANRAEREKMAEEIEELRKRNAERKAERAEQEKELAERRAAEDERRKAEEEERKRKKEEDESNKREARNKKMAEFDKFKNNPNRPNFVISKRSEGLGAAQEDEEGAEPIQKSKEQLEAEKQAILAQRIQKVDVNSLDDSKLHEKAKELHHLIYRLESEKYDLEKRFKEQQYDMMELAERARQMIKVGKGGLKRIQIQSEEEVDKIAERFAGAPAKVEMYSKFERQRDKRGYFDRRELYKGPIYGYAAEKITATRAVIWDKDTGLPSYTEEEGGDAQEVAAEGEDE